MSRRTWTVAVAWFFYRPLLATVLLVVAVGLVAGAKLMVRRRQAA